MQAGTYGQWGALLAGGEVIYPTGYGTHVTAVIIICVLSRFSPFLMLLIGYWIHWIWNACYCGDYHL